MPRSCPSPCASCRRRSRRPTSARSSRSAAVSRPASTSSAASATSGSRRRPSVSEPKATTTASTAGSSRRSRSRPRRRASSTSRRPFERELLDLGLEALAELSATQTESVLLNQDLHASNVLSSAREPWLAIDPKPLVGERAFGLAPIVRDYELGHGEAQAIGRLDRLCEDLGIDRERARRWALGQTLAWAFDGVRVLPHVETSRWLARAG
ncbi:MAG: hypothetical protein CL910_10105 [Deltaproteobacteria bacterium]|nr:hypothetical protein [Deltaproteobacteria bacterium]